MLREGARTHPQLDRELQQLDHELQSADLSPEETPSSRSGMMKNWLEGKPLDLLGAATRARMQEEKDMGEQKAENFAAATAVAREPSKKAPEKAARKANEESDKIDAQGNDEKGNPQQREITVSEVARLIAELKRERERDLEFERELELLLREK